MKLPIGNRELFIAAAALGVAVVVIVVVVSAVSDARTARLEREVEAAKQRAEAAENAAATLETAAVEYKQKIEYLEKSLVEIQAIARKQDEELENINADVDSARGNFERAKRVRSVAATAEELCGKLAQVGHGCGE
jgi:septal ring factor EnvC (AmiA/AmiB activator)